MPPLLTNSKASCRSEKLTGIVPPQEYWSTTWWAPPCPWDRPEHRRLCRHDDRRKTFWAGLIKSPRARVKPKRRSVSSRKIRPHPPRFGLSAAEPEVRIHLSPAASRTNSRFGAVAAQPEP